MPQPFTVPLMCPVCHQPFSVEIQLPRAFAERQAPARRTIVCPTPGCDGVIEPVIHGEVSGVWSGHGQKPAD
jgi:hypothetical protein